MKLIFLSLLIFAQLNLCSTTYKLLGELPFHGTKEFKPTEQGKYCAYYMTTDHYFFGDEIYFKVTLTNGNFENKNMFYGGSNDKYNDGDQIGLPFSAPYYSFNSSNTYNFIIPKISYKYLYIAPPTPSNYNSQSKITVSNSEGLTYIVLGELSKYSSQSFYPNEKGKYVVYCINTNTFDRNFIYLNVTINSGNFSHKYMYSMVSDTLLNVGTEVILSSFLYSSNYTFIEPIPFKKYLCFAPPPPINYDDQTRITIYNTYREYAIEYKVLGDLPKYSNETFYPYKKGEYCVYCINTDEFSKDDKLYFKVILTNESFEHKYMFYKGSNDKYNISDTINLLLDQVYYYPSSSTRNTYYFIISKPNYKYLYVAPPPPYVNYLRQTTFITFYNVRGSINKVLGEISKYCSKTFYPYEQGKYVVYYIDTKDFSRDDNFYFKVTLTNTNFEHEYMLYRFSDDKFNESSEIALFDHVYYNSSNNTENNSLDFYFIVPKSSEKYLYIAPPTPSNYNSHSKITVFNSYNFNSIAYKVLGKLTKYSNKTFNPYEQGKYCAYYINTDDFPTDDNLYFTVRLTNGSFEKNLLNIKMHYETFNNEFINGSLIGLNSWTDISYSKIEENNTYYFIVPKLWHKYLYIAPPPPSNYSTQSKITIYNTNNKTFTVLGELPKNNSKDFIPRIDGKYCVYYIKTDDFPNDDELYFKVVLTSGSFEHGYMNYGGYNTQFNESNKITLPYYVYYNSSTSQNISSNKYFTYYFVVPKTSYKYLYIAPPPPLIYDDLSAIIVYNIEGNKKNNSNTNSSNSNKVAIGVGVGVPCFVILVAVIVIILYKHKKGNLKSTSIDTSIIEPINLTSTKS